MNTDFNFEPLVKAGTAAQNCSIASFERFLTPSEAAAFLGGLNSRTVTRWAREGYLPAYPLGEGKRVLWRFLRRDLEAWLLERATRGNPACAVSSRHTLSSATDAPIRRTI